MPNNKRTLYLDNAATMETKNSTSCFLTDYLPFYRDVYCGNPSSLHHRGVAAKRLLNDMRKVIAESISANAHEIYFTSGGTESDNWAIKGVAEANAQKGKHIITSKIEHPAVLHSCEHIKNYGYEVTFLDVDGAGLVSLDDLEAAIRPDTVLVSIMAANNEVGTIEPIKEIGNLCHKHGVLFHTDAVQAYSHILIDVNEMNIDLMSVSGHKIGVPQGIGFLYIKEGTRIANIIDGGGQERGMRSGTENILLIDALGRNVIKHNMYNTKEIEAQEYRMKKIQERIDGIVLQIPGVIKTGHLVNRLSNICSYCFEGITGESLVILLDQYGICVSSGSACSSGALTPSHVLESMRVPDNYINGSLRVSTNGYETDEDIQYFGDKLTSAVKFLRS